MPMYHRVGQVPPKRHTQFRQPDGTLYTEELFGEEGFVGCSSLLYHRVPPTRVSGFRSLGAVQPREWIPEAHRHHHFKTLPIPAGGDPVGGRRVLMFNQDLTIGIVRPTE